MVNIVSMTTNHYNFMYQCPEIFEYLDHEYYIKLTIQIQNKLKQTHDYLKETCMKHLGDM